MSKIKTNRVSPRVTGGSLTIGEPRSTTYFDKDSDVVIPGYATKDYVDEVASAAPHGNPVFHLNDNKLVRSYTIPEGKNAGTFGELEMDDNVDVHVPDGSTWTIVGNKEIGSDGTVALSDLVDTDIPMIPQPDAMLWYDEFSGKWKPKTLSSLPPGEAGQNGEDGKSAYEIYAETTTDSPVLTVQEWLDSLQGEDGKDSMEVWLENNPGSSVEDYFEAMRGPIGPDGLSSFDLWLIDNPGGTEEEYWASLEGPQGEPGPGFDYKGNVATEADLPNDAGNPNSDGDAYFVEDVQELFAWGADDQWHSLGQIKGEQGDQGLQGESGDSAYEVWLKHNPGKSEEEYLESLKGEQGEDGLGQMVGVGSTVTLDAGESATVTQNPNLSTQEKIILDFGIPKGLDGINGSPGDEGLPGEDGASAYEIWLAAGNAGSEQDFLDSIVGDPGPDGDDGLSAYEIALDNGFVGTEEEWLKTLIGEQGPQGDGIHIKGHVSDESQLPSSGEVGDAYGDDNGDLWVYSDEGTWVNFGHVQGPAGENGADGKSAYASALDAGFVGSEEEWIASLKGDEGEPGESVKGDPGDPGKSAFEIAVEQGFQGTEDQWLESLKGEDGLLDDETLAQIQGDISAINSTLTPSSDDTVLTGHVTDNGDGTFSYSTAWEKVEHPDFDNSHTDGPDRNVTVGESAMSATTGGENVVMGVAAFSEGGDSRYENVVIGTHAGGYVDKFYYGDVEGNVLIGYDAGAPHFLNQQYTHFKGGKNNIIIGAKSSPSDDHVDNEITLGNEANDKFRIPGIKLEADASGITIDGQPIGGGSDSDHTDDNNNVLLGKDAELSDPSASNEIILGNAKSRTFRVPGIGLSADTNSVYLHDEMTGSKDSLASVSNSVEVTDAYGGNTGNFSEEAPEPKVFWGQDNMDAFQVSISGGIATFEINAIKANSIDIAPFPTDDGIWGCSNWVINITKMRTGFPVYLALSNYSVLDQPISVTYSINGNSRGFQAPDIPPSEIAPWTRHYYKFTTAQVWHFAEGFGDSHSSRFGKAGRTMTREEAIKEIEERKKMISDTSVWISQEGYTNV